MTRNILKTILLTIAGLLWLGAPTLSGHSGKPLYHLIIDTDAAVDDLRAVTTLLSCNDIRTLAILGSHGTLEAPEAARRVSSLLTVFGHEGIPVGIGRTLNRDLPNWHGFARSVKWGPEITRTDPPMAEAIELINQVTRNYPDKITWIALGALTNIADWLEANPSNVEKIERIIWYNSPDLKKGSNYRTDPEAYQRVISYNVDLQIVSNNRTHLKMDAEYLQTLASAGSAYSDHLFHVFDQLLHSVNEVKPHLDVDDDLAVLYLTCPLVFEQDTSRTPTVYVPVSGIPATYLAELNASVLASSINPNNQVFSIFPTDKEVYRWEVSEFLEKTIKRFGLTEWRSVVLTNEIHGHIGIYSIIGVKMGIRAMDWFNVGINNLEVISYAGSLPPYSCLNDGIQISTGSTIGQGLITIADTISAVPTVDFRFNGQTLRMVLDPDIATKMREDIAYGVEHYGFSDRYWNYIEKLAYQYWREMDRNKIFRLREEISL
ncbi:MAG: nucleoside hydrolase [Bacteroidales bacterium]